MVTPCPKDPSHQSTDSDYCSVCGARIAGAPGLMDALNANIAIPQESNSPSSAGIAADDTCPDCGTPRRMGARFCEVCRYNFQNRSPGGVAMTAVAPATEDPAAAHPTLSQPPAEIGIAASAGPSVVIGSSIDPAPSTMPPATEVAESGSRTPSGETAWEAHITVDPSLYVDPDPDVPCPDNDPERVFPIDLSDNLIGRRGPRNDIRPQIPVSDPGVSHRHAKILKVQDGSLLLLDVGSTNGTQLNGADVEAGVRMPLQDGDQITLGCWTRITLQGRQTG
jgi:hypothetical protein